ncbi:MAG TPA: aldehyde dehydrogenase family protein [Chloroflexota bacterium]|nr:aldehyde dehydrogenase family protein [Chloroflexota bacterium]
MAIATDVTTYKNFIAGEWTGSDSGQPLEIRNPVNGELVYRAISATSEDVNRAVETARTALETTDWSENPERRAIALRKLSDGLKAMGKDLARLLSQEAGKLFPVSLTEVNRGADAIGFYAGLARAIYGRTTTLNPDSLAIMLREPVGVVAIIVPWNMALSLLTRPMAPALAAGNALIVKPSSMTPGATAEFIKLIEDIEEFPKGIVNFLIGPGGTVGDQIVKHPDIDMISFTGDTSTGKHVVRTAADTLKKVSLELGGKSPNIIFEDADLDRAVKGAINGASFFNAGQVCIAGSRVIIPSKVHDEFVDRMKTVAENMKVGDGLERGVQLGPVISKGQQDRIYNYIEKGKSEAQLVTGGYRYEDGPLSKGYFVPPTIFDKVPVGATIAQEEIFGPVVAVQTFEDEEDAARVANSTVYGLAAAVWTKDINKALRVAKKVRSGMVWINTFGKLFAAAEMGGAKQSGIGRSYGLEGLHEFTELKHINIQLED